MRIGRQQQSAYSIINERNIAITEVCNTLTCRLIGCLSRSQLLSCIYTITEHWIIGPTIALKGKFEFDLSTPMLFSKLKPHYISQSRTRIHIDLLLMLTLCNKTLLKKTVDRNVTVIVNTITRCFVISYCIALHVQLSQHSQKSVAVITNVAVRPRVDSLEHSPCARHGNCTLSLAVILSVRLIVHVSHHMQPD